jgi:hypothetical protein
MGEVAMTHESTVVLSSALDRKDRPFLPLWAWGVLLAAMPALSFALQLWFSSQDNTLPLLFSHYTVSYIDWVFVPFNFFVVYTVNWRRGGLLFFAMVLSLVFNVISHAYWQYALVENPGYMFGREHIVLRSGWVHVCYATIQMTLLLAFLLVRKPSSKYCGLLTCLCVIYFVSGGISGYVMNDGFMMTDVIMVSMGLAMTLFYPRFAYGLPKRGFEPGATNDVMG